MENLDNLLENFIIVCNKFPRNTTEKNAFLAVCKTNYEPLSLDFVNGDCPYGGEIGIGHSPVLHNIFKRSKVIRVHAIFHDANGYLRSRYQVGPGYLYVIKQFAKMPDLLNCCLLGQFSGMSYWLGYKLFKRGQFKQIPF